MSKIMPNYYRTLVTPASIIKPSQKSTYSIYDGYLYGTPTVNGRSGSLTLGLNNNLEMKVRERSDTAVTEKKVSLLDNLNFNTSYNPFKKTLKWSPVTMQGATTLFNKKLSLNFGATFNPYALDSLGNTVNRFLFRESGRLFRTTNAYFSMRFTLQSAAGDKSKTGTTGTQEAATPTDNPTLDMLDESTAYNTGSYVDFSIPWSLNVDYQWNYSKTGLKSRYTHTVRLSGSINLTSKWKIGLTSGYDFIAKKITTTNFSVHRDLHCCEMQFSVIPFGQRRSYSFTINAKASVLRDIKYNKSKSWQDYF
jgi:hypothetical protein